MNKQIKFFFFLLIIFCSACSSTKNIPDGDFLYTGADVKLKSDEKVKDKKIYKEELEDAIRPKPNSKLLGMRYRLWIYNMMGKVEKEKGLKHWLKYRVGEPPVLLSAADPSKTSDALRTLLENRGIFKAKTEYEVVQKEKKAHVEYTANIHPPYTINNYVLMSDTIILASVIHKHQEDKLIKTGENFDLSTLEAERLRLEEALKNEGYYYFNADNLVFQTDSTLGNRTVNLFLNLKSDLPKEVSRIYRINNVTIFPEYSLTSDSSKFAQDTVLRNDLMMVGKLFPVKPKVIARSVFTRPNEIYSRENHNLTLNRLMGLGIYKFVNVRFDDIENTGADNDTSATASLNNIGTGDSGEIDALQAGLLNTYIFLTPLKKRITRFELQAVSRSNNFAGPGISASFRNRNFLKGAELFLMNFRFNYETQITGSTKGINSYTFEFSPELNVPKFIVPFFNIKSSSRFVPTTKFKLGYDLLIKPEFYQLNSLSLLSGYRWKESLIKDHDLNVVNVTYLKVARESEEFLFLLSENDFLRRSFQEQFIIGSSINLTFGIVRVG